MSQYAFSTGTKILFVDSSVHDYQTLMAGLKAEYRWHLIDAAHDGIAHITQTLHQYSSTNSIQEIHILTHGSPGCLQLGHAQLSLETLDTYSQSLKQWFATAGSVLVPQLVLYGCNAAAGDAGAEFIEQLHHLTGAEIAASTTLVGSAALGGNWDLDYSTDRAATGMPIRSEVLATYAGVLVNPPTITDKATADRITAEETALAITKITIDDPEASEVQTVTLTVNSGTLELASTDNLTGLTGDKTATVSFSGSLTDINAAIDGMSYTPDLNYSGDDSLLITVDDGNQSAISAIALSITPVNDESTIAPTSLTVAEGNQGAFAADNFNIVDTDSLDVQIIIKIASLPSKGALKFDGSFLVPGSTFSYDQIDKLEYFHDGTQTTTAGGTEDSFTITVDDGAGGTIAETTIPITITPVNQLPTATGDNTLFEGEEDYAVTITVTDPDQTAANYGIEIDSLPTDGVLKFDGGTVKVGDTFSSAELTKFTYSHDGNDEGFGNPPPDSFDIIVTDDGGGTGTPESTTATIDLNIKPNNDDPVLVNNKGLTLNTLDGLTKVITKDDLSVSDPDSATTQLTYTLITAPDPTLGNLEVFNNDSKTWQSIGAGVSFTQDDLNSNRVRYEFHRDSTGGQNFSDSFQFQVRDSEIREYPSEREGGIWKADGSDFETLTFTITTVVPPTGSGGPGGTQNPEVTENNPPVTDINTGIAGVAEGSVTTIDATLLRTTDTDNKTSEIVYRLASLPTSGSVELDGKALGLFGSFTQADVDNNLVTFKHAGGEDFIDDFRFTVSDGTNVTTFEETFTIDVTPINDAPTIAAKGSPFLKEGDSLTIDKTYITLNDVDGSGEKKDKATFSTVNNLTFKVTDLPDYGTLKVDQGSGFVEVTTDTIITQAQLNDGKLRYDHDGDEQFKDSFKVRANDNTTAANNLSGEATINLAIASLNDDPEFDSKQTLTVAEGGTGAIGGTDAKTNGDPYLLYTDPDNSTIQRQYRITDATDFGTLFLNGKALSVNSVFTQADLDAGNRITYIHDGSENHLDGFDFKVSDGGGAAVPGSYVIEIDPVNNTPELKVPDAQIFDTDTPLTFNTDNDNRITVDDIDLETLSADETDVLRVTVDLKADDTIYTGSTLTLASTTDLTVTGNNGDPGGTVTFEGTKDAVQAALDGLQVQVPTDEDRVLDLVVTVNDLKNGGPDPDPAPAGYTTTVTETIKLFTSNENDAPVVDAPDDVTVTEDIKFKFTGGDTIKITDVDAFNSTSNTVTLEVNDGTITVGNPGLITGGANNSSTVTLTGSLDDINNAIANLSYKGDKNFNGTDTLKITANDQGNTGLNNTNASDPQEAIKTVDITLNPANDAPTLEAPDDIQTITEVSPKVFSTGNKNAITIDDLADAPPLGTDNFTVTVKATNEADGLAYGTLNATTGTGAAITGQGTDTLTLSGTKAEINAALDGLSYAPDSYNSEVSVNLAVTVDDEANGGPGALTATDDITIQVSSINDEPVVTNPTAVVATEDQPFSFIGADKLFIDDPDDFGNPLTVTLSVGDGKLTLGTTDGLTFDAGSNISGSMTITGTEADLNAALATLTYKGDQDFNGADALSFMVDDLGNTGSGDPGIVNNTIDITVDPVNDAPTRKDNQAVPFDTNEDAAPSGTSVENLFLSKFVDDADEVTGGSTANDFAGVAIFDNNATTTQGKWQWSSDGTTWNDLATNVSNAAAVVLPPTAKLRFLPNADFNGQPGDLRLRLIDTSQGAVTAGDTVDVRTRGGSTQYSNSALRLDPNVTAINDAPIATGTSTLAAVDEDATNPPGDTVTNLFTDRFDDAKDEMPGGSTANTLAGVAVVGNAATTEGIWQYFNGSAWQDVGSPSDTNALLVAASDRFRFVPSANYNGPVPALTVHLIDDSAGAVTTGNTVDLSGVGTTGDTTAYSSATVPLDSQINPVNDAPTLNNLGATVDFTENGTAVVLDGDASVNDLELDSINNWDGSTLTLERNGGANDEDVFGNSGTLGALTEGSPVTVGGTAIATVTTNSNGTLTLTFNNNATGALVTSALQQITYSNSSEAPPASVNIEYTLNDGNTGAQGSDGALTAIGNVTVDIDANPDAVNDTFIGQENQLVTGNVFNDNGSGVDDLGDNPVTVATSGTSTNGVTVTINNDGTFNYTPAANFNGVDTFDYTITDADGDTSTATVTITIEPGPPLTVNDLTVNEGSPYAVFTVGGATGQGVTLALADGTATGADYGPGLEYWDGTNWQTYTPASVVNIPAGETTLLVRTTITDDTPFEGAETFTLTATNTEGTNFTGTATIVDDGTGVKYPGTVTGGLPDTATSNLDNDAAAPAGTGGADTIIGGDGDDVINGLSDNDFLDGGAGNDVINGGSESDIVIGGIGDDVLNGGSGDDEMTAGAGNDVANGGSGNDRITGDDGEDLINGGSGNDTLDGGNGDDVLQGSSGNDLLLGGIGADFLDGGRDNDILAGGDGADTLIGGQGDDIFRFSAVSEFGDTIVDFEIVSDRLQFTNIPGLSSNTVQFRQQGLDTIVEATVNGALSTVATLKDVNAFTLGSEHLIFGDAIPTGSPADSSSTAPTAALIAAPTAEPSRPRTLTLAQADDYLASNIDLLQAFGYDLAAAQNHYAQLGFQENRSTDTFDEDLYLASNADLINAFGYDLEAATRHYIQNGYAEGRSTQGFNPAQYLASRPDLQAAFGDDLTAATRHYIETTSAENRDPLLGFDGGAYIASYADLASAFGYNPQQGLQHYINFGMSEGRRVTFEADDYIASHGDLIRAFGTNFDAGTEHYILLGMSEGRAVDTFDEVAYLNKYVDLQAAFGNDLQAATQHYITNGFFEGRTA